MGLRRRGKVEHVFDGGMKELLVILVLGKPAELRWKGADREEVLLEPV